MISAYSFAFLLCTLINKFIGINKASNITSKTLPFKIVVIDNISRMNIVTKPLEKRNDSIVFEPPVQRISVELSCFQVTDPVYCLHKTSSLTRDLSRVKKSFKLSRHVYFTQVPNRAQHSSSDSFAPKFDAILKTRLLLGP